MVFEGKPHGDFDGTDVQSNETHVPNLPTSDLVTPAPVERPPYDEQEYKKLVSKVDRLSTTEGGQAFLWAISRPGACSHFFLHLCRPNSHMSPMASTFEVLDELKKGGQITMDQGKALGYDESHLSLHVSNGAGVSTAIVSDSHGIFGGDAQAGLVLKPEYFDKLSNFGEEELAELQEKPDIKEWGEAATINNVAKSIKNKTWTRFGNAAYEKIHADYGIRNVTIADGELQEVPITAEDVEFFFYVNSWEPMDFSFISPKTGQYLTSLEISRMAQLCQDDKVREHYMDTRNIAAVDVLETIEETMAKIAKRRAEYPNEEQRIAVLREEIQKEWEKAEGPI